jgi:hypothetical protein
MSMSYGIAGAPALERVATKTITFDGTAGNGAVGTVAVFTVTGDVFLRFITARCSVDLVSAGAGTIILGVASDTNVMNTVTTATTLDAGEWWVGGAATTATAGQIAASNNDVVVDGNIIITVATGDITAGALIFYAIWIPLSANGNVS